MDEAVTTLASPASANPAIPAFQYNFGANSLATLVTANPLLCGNTAAATGVSPTGIMPVYYSANGSVGSTPQPFVFGAASGSPSTSAVAYGVTNVVYNGNQVRFSGDPLDALVCYGLDANGVHKVTRDLFADDFEVSGTGGLIGNSTVTLSVFHLPAGAPNNYYGYTVDVTIPSLPAATNCGVGGLDCNFSLIEGYDTSVFDPNQGGWCLAGAGAQSCPGATTLGDININYANYGSTTSLAAPIGSAQPLQAHFVVFRYFKSGVSALPVSGAPVAMAALFSPHDLEENKLDDNVSTGNNTLANVAPGVVNDSTYTAFTGAVAALQENTDSSTLTFKISDPDSPESTGNLLHASTTLYLPGGIQVPIAADCGSTTPITTLPVTRTCTIDIPLNNGTFWNSAVGLAYQNQFSNVATDTTNGTYASGISASIQIVATDAQGKNGTPVSTPVHIFSSKNDAPVATFDANQLPSMVDSNDSNTYPTWTCSVSGSPSPSCGTPSHGIIDVTIAGALNALPGPISAFDELSAQTTAVVPFSDPNDSFTDVQCTKEQSGDVFATNGGPVVSVAAGTSYSANFWLPATAPASAVSALCVLTMTDAESPGFPNSESAATAQSTFRIVVNP